MQFLVPPTHVGADHWPVLSGIRVTSADTPAEFIVVVDCGDGTPDHPYATLHVRAWPGRQTAGEGEYNLTFEQARHSLAERVGLRPASPVTVEVIVSSDPDVATEYAVFVNCRPGRITDTVRVIMHHIDLGAVERTAEWAAGQAHAAATLSPAAARHARNVVLRAAGAPEATSVGSAADRPRSGHGPEGRV